MTDLIVYSIVIPVLPFRLERLGYSGVSALVGWLLFSYVRSIFTITLISEMLIYLCASLLAW